MRGLYVHIPFCRSKCPYCAFYSIDGFTGQLAGEYTNALIRDFESIENKDFDTLYIGGGTPSMLPYKDLERLLKALPGNGAEEFTFEMNPDSADEDTLRMLGDHGVNRISLGCQSTDNEVLKLLGRVHDRDDIFKAVDMVRSLTSKADLNLDIIYDIPSVPQGIISTSLNDITSMEPEHISAYSYSFDTGHLQNLPGWETEEQYLATKSFLLDKGYEKYEISNFAKHGHRSLHNINYWNLGDFCGIGASAWSLHNKADRRVHSGRQESVEDYINDPLNFGEVSTTEGTDLPKENVIFGLRMLDGVNIAEITERWGDFDGLFKQRIDELIKEELLQWKEENLAVTEKGELLLDSVLERLW
ncbi:radical SAM family heme chaperone HemW [Limisalsivibrio acetivorans]|uniref:radical SAM family heme chaperone HemW n=1 Tax=Limisalsivibrio acetivorans TaxID=1304888 RepID=UPI0003B72AF5|nr:radical SAM family heme chaperone HemW [Limisalsivibrio acetivorans]